MRTLPLLPALDLIRCFTPPLHSSLPFPLNHTRTRSYYFARNGVWESTEVLGLHEGDEALMPSYTSGIEVEALEARGIVPIFYKLNSRLEPDFKDIEKKITLHTKLFYLIHYFGFPQPIEAVQILCEKFNLFFFEDNALGFLSADASGKPLGSTGDVGLFCPRKTLPLPHGGMLVVNNPSISLPSSRQSSPSMYSTIGETVSLIVRNTMQQPGVRGRFARAVRTRALPSIKNLFSLAGLTHTASGSGSFDIATATWKMSKFAQMLYPTFDYSQIVAKRRSHYAQFTERIAPLQGKGLSIVFPELKPHTCPLEYMIIVDDVKDTAEKLARCGIECGLHWWWERPRKIASQFPNLKAFTDHALLLPIHQDLQEKDIDYIAQELTNKLKNDSISSS